MESKRKCIINFQMKIETPLTDQVFISGNIEELGNWDPFKSLKLISNEQKHPTWTSENPLELEEGTKFQFKCVVMNGKTLKRWEVLPNDLNRRYRARYLQVTLKGTENKVEGSEIIEKGDKTTPGRKKTTDKMNSEKKEKKQEKVMSIEFNDKTIVKKRNLDGHFNPFSFADSGSDADDIEENQSFSASFISLDHQDSTELIADKINATEKSKALDEKIEEITSPRTPPSMDEDVIQKTLEQPKKGLKKINNYSNFNAPGVEVQEKKKLHLHEIFQQIKDKPKWEQSPQLRKESETLDEIREIPNGNLDQNEDIIIVSRFLPLRVRKTVEGWEVNHSEENPLINLMAYLYNDVKDSYQKARFVGWLRDEVAQEDREDLKTYLMKNYRCMPIFFSSNQKAALSDLYMHDEITIIDMVTNNCYVGKESLSISTAWAKRNIYWEAWVNLNKDYADQILTMMNEKTMVVICEYNLILIPTYIMRGFSKPLIAIYFNINFPGFENFRLIPYKEEILNGLLSSSIICFNDYSHVSEFFTLLNILKGIQYESKQGLTYFKYMGRTIYVKMKMPTVDPERIESLQSSEEFEQTVNVILKDLHNINLLVGIDPPSELSGLEIKFNLIFKYVKETKNKYKLKLIQFFNKNPFSSNFLTESTSEFYIKVRDLANTINEEYLELQKKEDYPALPQNKLIDIRDLTLSENELLAYFTVAKVYLKTSIKSTYSMEVMSFVAANQNFGYALVTEFLNLNNMCSKILKFNPLMYSEFRDNIIHILHVKRELTMAFQYEDLRIMRKSSISLWLSSLLTDLKRIGEAMRERKLATIEKNNNLLLTKKMMLMSDRFEYLPIEKVIYDYKKSQNRLILLDYEGTIVKYDYYTCITRTFKSYSDRFHMVSLHPSDAVIKDIMFLAQDQDNYVNIITGNKVEYLDHWFGHLLNVGLSAEYGFFYKNKGTTKWGNLFSMDWSWKEIVKKIFENYKKNTEGSEIESKDSCIAWKYHEVQQDFGKKQADALINHLKSTLEYFKQIEIFQGNNYIEVRPKGINKGAMTECLIRKRVYEKNSIDFLLCIGDGLSDEEMFTAIKRHVHERPKDFSENFEPYTCILGKKPSNASFYLNNTGEVLNLLHLLKEASD